MSTSGNSDLRSATTIGYLGPEGTFTELAGTLESFGDYIDDTNRYREGHRLELFHLAADIGERNNLAAREPARAAALQKKLHAWIRSCGAEIPGPNPRFDPERCLEEVRERPGARG